MGNQNTNSSRQNQRIPGSNNQNPRNGANRRNVRRNIQQPSQITPEVAYELQRRIRAAGLMPADSRRRSGVRNSRRNAAFNDYMIDQIEQAQLQYVLQRSRVETEQAPKGPPPINPKVLSQLSETCLELSDLKDGNEQCVVCFEKQQPGDLGVILPCGHAFHKLCIFEWLKRHNTCPVCRLELNEHFNKATNVQKFMKKMEDRRNEHKKRIENQKQKLELIIEPEELFIEVVKGIEVSKWKIKQLKEFLNQFKVSGIETYKEKSDIVKLVNNSVTIEYLGTLERENLEEIANFLTIPVDEKCSDDILRQTIQVSAEKLCKGV